MQSGMIPISSPTSVPRIVYVFPDDVWPYARTVPRNTQSSPSSSASYITWAHGTACTCCCWPLACSKSAIDQYLLPAGLTAANPPPQRQTNSVTDGRLTDKRTDRHPTVSRNLLCILGSSESVGDQNWHFLLAKTVQFSVKTSSYLKCASTSTKP